MNPAQLVELIAEATTDRTTRLQAVAALSDWVNRGGEIPGNIGDINECAATSTDLETASALALLRFSVQAPRDPTFWALVYPILSTDHEPGSDDALVLIVCVHLSIGAYVWCKATDRDAHRSARTCAVKYFASRGWPEEVLGDLKTREVGAYERDLVHRRTSGQTR